MVPGGGRSFDSPPPCGSRGFTLIEIMVVMVIIAVLASLVTLSVSGRAVDDRMEAESRRLEQLFRIASDEAQAKGVELGFRHTPKGFEFVTPDASTGRWRLLEDGMFRPREVLEPFYLELRIDGRVVKPVAPAPHASKKNADDAEEAPEPQRRLSRQDEEEERKKAEATQPQILILSTGEMTAFTLDLKLKDLPNYYRLEGNALGELHTHRSIEEKNG
jgi:general secretion pathway protein H